MRLAINNLLDNTKTEMVLEERNYLIGRDASSDIILDNFFVSEKQAILRIERDQVGIKPVGEAQMKLNGEVLSNNATYVLAENDEIVVGQYSLALLADAEASFDEEETSEALSRLNDLERLIHEELIERLDLRKLDPSAMSESQYRERVGKTLDPLIEEHIDDAESDIADFVSQGVLAESACQLHRDGQSSTTARQRDGFQLGTLTRKVYESAIHEITKNRKRPVNEEELENWIRANFDKFRYQIQPGTKAQLLRDYLRGNLMDIVFGLGPLEPLLKMSSVSEIMVVEPRLIYIEKNGSLQKSSRKFVSDSVALSVIERIVAPLGLRLDRSSPLVDARLPDGSRVNVVIPPLAIKGPCITIRKFSAVPLTMADLVKDKKALTQQVSEFLKASVLGSKNILISGGTGSGKTTLLNCLSEFIPRRERIVTVEDSAELQLKQEHVVSLESRPANAQGKGAYTIRDLVKNSLRMRPDRIIVGECRGSETLDMLQAMNTGHDGSMSTGHANSPEDMIRRLETMVLLGADIPIRAIRDQIASAIDLIIQITRFADGARKVTHVSEIVGVDPDTGEVIVEDIFRYGYVQGETAGVVHHTGYIPTYFAELMQKVGISLDILFEQELAADRS